MKLDNRVAIITGGNRGIGLAAAKFFRQEGARVVITGRDEIAGRAALQDLQNGNNANDVLFVPADVTNHNGCQRIVNETIGAFGRLDILFNNAGIILRNRTVEATTEEEWDATMDTNVKSMFLLSRAALPQMRAAGGGAIVNTSSYLGLVGSARSRGVCSKQGCGDQSDPRDGARSCPRQGSRQLHLPGQRRN